MMGDVGDMIIRAGNPLDPTSGQRPGRAAGRIDHLSFGISPWEKSYHTTTPNGYNLQISYNTLDTRLNLAVAVNPGGPGNK